MLPFYEYKDVNLFVYQFHNFQFRPHFHNSLELLVVEVGSITLIYDGVRHVVQAGEVAVVFPGRVHSYEWDGTENGGYVILLKPALLGEFEGELMKSYPKQMVYPLAALPPDCVHAIEVLRKAEGESLRLQRVYTALFLCRFLPEAELVAVRAADDRLLYSLVEYMNAHFQEPIALTDVADALYISKFHLSHVFSNTFQMHFNDYLNALRINLAMQLMECADKTFTDIAFEVGFSNVRTFNRAFKKQCGVTPSEFRRMRAAR